MAISRKNLQESKDKKNIVPAADNIEINTDSGEVTVKSIFSDLDVEQRKDLERVKIVSLRICEKGTNIMENEADVEKVARALASLNNHGETYFHNVYRIHPEYNQAKAKRIWEEAIKNPAKKPAKFYSVAKDYDIDVTPSTKADKKEEESIDVALPDYVDKDDYKQFAFFEDRKEKSYWSIGPKGQIYEVSNFLMRILYHVKGSHDAAYRLIEITNKFGYKAVINLNTDDFVSTGSFKKVVAREGNFIFKGTDVDLCRLQDKLQREEKATTMVNTLGYNKRGNFYSFANGIFDTSFRKILICHEITFFNDEPKFKKFLESCRPDFPFKPVDDYGIVYHNKNNYFIPALSKIFADKEDQFINDKKFVYKKSDVTFELWTKKYHEVYGDKGKIAIMFYVACLMRDIIYPALNRRFPILCLYGLRGSGKGTFAQSILRLFGDGQDQYMLGGAGTAKGFMRKFSQYSNSIVWLDEYKNNLNKFFIESLKNIYDGIGYERAKSDNSFETQTTPIRSGSILSGQEMPTIEPALFTRVILLVFQEAQRTDAGRKSFGELMAMENKGLSHITVYLLKYRHLFEKNYKNTFETCFKEIIKEVNNNEVDERLMLNIAALVACSKIITEVETFPFSHQEFKSFIIENMISQHYVLAGSDDISKFWQVVESLFNQSPAQVRIGHDFELEGGYLWIRIQQVHGLYQKELSARRDSNILARATLDNYLEVNKKQFIGKKKKMFKDGSYTLTWQFKYSELNINLIKEENIEEREAKYKEMGINVNEDELRTKKELDEVLPNIFK